MVMVFAAVGLPLDSIGLLFGIDWFLDRLRTATNVIGDAFGAAIIDHYERDVDDIILPSGDEEASLTLLDSSERDTPAYYQYQSFLPNGRERDGGGGNTHNNKPPSGTTYGS
jgi:hypothetical protein